MEEFGLRPPTRDIAKSLCRRIWHFVLSLQNLMKPERPRTHSAFYPSLIALIFIYLIVVLLTFFVYNQEMNSYASKLKQMRVRREAAISLIQQRPQVREVRCQVFLAPPESWNPFLQKMSEVTPMEEVFDYSDCYRLKAQFLEILTTQMEDEFPIAFSIMVYHDLQRFTRLLRAIYRPSNVYCIHVDQRSNETLMVTTSSIRNLTSCFDNVFLPPDPINVWWGSWETLEAEMVCLRALWKHKVKWMALINLTGEEFPLKTNLELVHILRIMDGTNDVWIDPCTFEGPGDHTTAECRALSDRGFQERWEKYTPYPYNIHPYKGQIHAVLFRPTVDFILHNPKAQVIYKWANKTFIPDELFFSTINGNPQLGVPGSNPSPRTRRPSIARAKLWRWRDQRIWKYCSDYLRNLCKFTARDLPYLTTTRQLFANKFKSDYRPVGYSCLEQWYFERVIWELLTNEVQINLHQYHLIFHSHYYSHAH